MNETVWTSGPWSVDEHSGGAAYERDISNKDGWFLRITPNYSLDELPEGEFEATIALIAAAPAMAEELDNQVRNCLGCGGDGVFLTTEPPSERMVQKPCEHCANARALLNTIREKGNG